MMTPLSHLLPSLPYLPLPQTYAPWPVWSDSTTAPIRFAPMPKKAAVRLWHRARDFDRDFYRGEIVTSLSGTDIPPPRVAEALVASRGVPV